MKTEHAGLLFVATLTLVGAAVFTSGVGANLAESPVDDQPAQLQTQTQQQLHNVSFDVDNLTAPENATAGETIAVTADITNPADVPMIQYVVFRLDGDVVDRTAFALNPGETETVAFDINTTGVPAGTHIHGVETQDRGEVATIEIAEPPAGNETTTATATPSGNETTTATATETPAGNATTA
ncbi:MAG: hypothetical protein ABEJ61_00300 [Haloferacaceae archaeon]